MTAAGTHPGDAVRKFYKALPAVREWVAATLAAHADRAVPVRQMGYARLAGLFPAVVLDRARVVTVADTVPFPPLSHLGPPELAPFEAMPIAGVTYRNTFFVRRGHLSESLFCHELVHVVQWERLGVDRFLLAYGIGLVQFGYRESPLEAMAYDIQTEFERGELAADGLMERIGKATDSVWKAVSPSSRSPPEIGSRRPGEAFPFKHRQLPYH